MSKHVLDRSRAAVSGRLARYLSIERGSGLHPAVRALHRKRAAPRGLVIRPDRMRQMVAG